MKNLVKYGLGLALGASMGLTSMGCKSFEYRLLPFSPNSWESPQNYGVSEGESIYNDLADSKICEKDFRESSLEKKSESSEVEEKEE